MASTSTLAPHSPFLSRLPPQKPFANLNSPKTRFPKFPLLASVSSSQSFEEREEHRWLREEQRWLREEQRWLREEERWKQEREKLLDEIVRLRMQIEMTEKGKKLSKFDVEVVRGEITERADVKEMVFEEFVKVDDVIVKEVKEEKRENKEKEREKKKSERDKSERRALRVGSEGDDVKAMQEALQKLGFYSGEEDMEFSSFSSGTLRAVKTWQASLGTTETGIMTDELLAILFSDNEITDSPSKSTPESINGGTIASVAKIEEKIIKENDDDNNSEVSKYSGSGVFLLGENRWEEPSRLIKNNNNLNTKNITKCLTCRGEGRLMCTECDGTGEPNIEPQFMEWVDEGMKCPYCDGLGYTICDVCQGITSLQN